MKRPLLVSIALVLAPALAGATEIRLDVRTPGSDVVDGVNHVVVTPNRLMRFEVVGELGDDRNEGLAMIAFDLVYDGGPLPKMATPLAGVMGHFAFPDGVNNPAGFGGTRVNGDLLQVGGAQNTFNNTFAPQPIGNVLTGVAHPGSPQLLAQGGLRTPQDPGIYTVVLQNPMANVIREGETGSPFWAVEAARPGRVRPLVIEVQAVVPLTATVSVSAGGTQELLVDAGVQHAGAPYIVLGSASGTAPGVGHQQRRVPLNDDDYFRITLGSPNSSFLPRSRGVLDENGRARATFRLPPGLLDASWVGRRVHHTFVVHDGRRVAWVGNPVAVELVP